jgi:hypothetical protein
MYKWSNNSSYRPASRAEGVHCPHSAVNQLSRRTFLGTAASLIVAQPLLAMTEVGDQGVIALVDRRYSADTSEVSDLSVFSGYTELLTVTARHMAQNRIVIGLTCGVGLAIATQVARGTGYRIATGPAGQIEKVLPMSLRRSANSALALVQGANRADPAGIRYGHEPTSVAWILLPARHAMHSVSRSLV